MPAPATSIRRGKPGGERCLSGWAMLPETWLSTTVSPPFAVRSGRSCSYAKRACGLWNGSDRARARQPSSATKFWRDPPTDDGSRHDRVAVPARPTRIAPDRIATLDDGVGRRLFLVSCVKTKLPTPASAKNLYISDWFCKARACVESTGCRWRILSAQYGLVHPDEEIRPYEETLNTMPIAERRAWARDVLEAMDPCLVGVDTVVFLAGARYREFLEPALRERGVAVSVPMSGLSQGRQLAWLNACLHG